MARRKRTRSASPSMVQAIFDPAGDINVRAVAPSGNVYEITPRTSFQIVSEDVDWFFHEWDAQHRRCLSRVEAYQPRRAQFDNGEASRLATVTESEPSVALEAAPVDEPVPEPEPTPEPMPEPDEITEPDSAIEADKGETDEDKE